jgi:hypothetical protein
MRRYFIALAGFSLPCVSLAALRNSPDTIREIDLSA